MLIHRCLGTFRELAQRRLVFVGGEHQLPTSAVAEAVRGRCTHVAELVADRGIVPDGGKDSRRPRGHGRRR
jgi:hypothetical protein